jgi:23S rRNA (cytosine1962-C5)-methyltransferase
MSRPGRVVLNKGRDGPVRGGNPWIFSRAIERAEPSGMVPGAIVEVYDAAGNRIGYGHYNPATTIAVRMLAWGDSPPVTNLIRHRVTRAAALRGSLPAGGTDCYRVVNGDGDGLSGLVLDRYGDVFAMQLLSAGMDAMRSEIVSVVNEIFAPRAIVERSQGAVRREEGLADQVGPIDCSSVPPVVVTENGIRFEVEFEHSQKTGAFLDQRENHARLGAISAGASLLDLYSYAGGFSLAALAGGARRVTAVDSSARALDSMRRNLELNGHPAGAAEIVRADAAEFLRGLSGAPGNKFDLIALDPPPLARTRAQGERAGRLYTELNALAMRALAPGGRLMTFSCSTHFRGEDFVNAVRAAQALARARLRMIARLGPGVDHPVLLGHVEGEYLTGLLLADLD